jgi:hypothetical protein
MRLLVGEEMHPKSAVSGIFDLSSLTICLYHDLHLSDQRVSELKVSILSLFLVT